MSEFSKSEDQSHKHLDDMADLLQQIDPLMMTAVVPGSRLSRHIAETDHNQRDRD